MLSKKLSISFLIILVLLSLSTTTKAQNSSTTGDVVGNVKDAQGLAIVGANVTIEEAATGITKTVSVREDGIYNFSSLRPGKYKILVKKEGFANIERETNVRLGSSTIENISLTTGETSYLVEVNSDSLLETKTENSTSIEQNQIQNLPINQRRYLDFAFTTPRITPDRLPADAITATSGLSVNGQSARFNSLTIDGLANNDYVLGAGRSTFNQDSVQEFQVVSDSYAAEFGRAIGGIINIVTKSGGNDLHSRLFLLNRNSTISAREAFSPTKSDTKQYQFGLTLSGPIKKDKAFFFSSFERSTSKLSKIVTISDEIIASARRKGYDIRNGPNAYALGITTALAKADFQLGLKDTLAVRYNGGFTYNGDSGNFGGLTAFSNTGIQRLRENSFALSNTYTSTTFINESRFFYSRREQNIDQTDNKVRVRLFAPEGTVDFGRNLDLPLERQEDIYQFVDNILVTRGRHNVKTGVDFAYTKLSDVQFSNKSGGVYSFQPLNFADLLAQPGLPSFTTLQAFDPQLVRSPEQIAFLQLLAQRLPTIIPNFPTLDLANLALPTFYEQSFGRSTRISGNLQSLSLFIQDDFKLQPNLLIKAGLRYDINRIKFAPNNNGNFSPRLAIAYHPQKLPHLNLRAAYGLFFGIPSVGSILNARIDSQTTTSVLLFPFSILPTILPMSRFPESNQPPTNIPNTPQLSEQFIVDNKLRNSYGQQISTGIDYSFNNRTSLSLTYNFVKGIKLLATRNINPEVPPSGFFDLVPNRNDPTKGDVQELESAFNSAYHAFTILFNTQFNNRFNLLAHYTFSKSIDDVVDILPNFQETVNPLRPGEEKALSLQDLRNRLVVSGTWQLDYRKNRLLKDFQLSTIISLNSGRPYNLLAGADLDENRINADRPLTLGRNVGITPGFANVDLRLSRVISINEKIKLEVIVEAFNLFNHVNINPNEINRVFLLDQQGNFNLPKKEGSRFSLPAERYKGAFAPRQFQIGFRLNF